MPHKLDDNTMISTALLRRGIYEGQEEGGDGRHFFVLQRRDRGFLHHAGAASPDPDGFALMFMHELLTLLNDELHHDGAWLGCFTLPFPVIEGDKIGMEYKRFVLLWMDKQGDVHVPVDWMADASSELLDFADAVAIGREAWANLCEQGWQAWHKLNVEVLDAAGGQQFNQAAGERAPSTFH